MKLYNQNDYAGVPYPAPGYENATVKSGGCGVVCAAMLIENLTQCRFPPEEAARYAIKNGARVSGGTDMRRLSDRVSEDFKLKTQKSDRVSELAACLNRGGMVIANVGGDRTGYSGIFSNGGHYVVVFGLEQGQLVIGDPGLYKGKYDKPHRKSVTVRGGLCYSAPEVLDEDCRSRSPRYYLFETEEKEMTGEEIYKALCEYLRQQPVPQWAAGELEEAISAGITDGSRPTELVPRYQAAIMAKRAAERAGER